MQDRSKPGYKPTLKNTLSADSAVIRSWVREGRTRIDARQAGTRLDRYLAQRFTYRSRTQWGHLIRGERITVNDRRAKPSLVLRDGDLIRYVPLQREEPQIDATYELLHLDDSLVAVSKSGNIPMHPSGRYFHHTLLHLLLSEHPEWGRLHVIHRLDRETSGIVIFGRSRADTNAVAAQFRQRTVAKRYLALVEGSPAEERFIIDLPLGQARGSAIRKAVGIREDGTPARTEVRVLHRGAGWTWVEARPETGRLHQIRVHLKAAGLPILGDKIYGRTEEFFLKFIADEPLTKEEQAILGLARQALHAYQLQIRHPRSGEPLTLIAPLPEDIGEALAARGLDPTPWLATAER